MRGHDGTGSRRLQTLVGGDGARYSTGMKLAFELPSAQADKLRDAPVTAKALRDYSRVFFASASDESPDKQGRITIPPALREYAGLQRDCAVVGANTRLEIWEAGAWQSYLDQQEDAFSAASEEVLPGIL